MSLILLYIITRKLRFMKSINSYLLSEVASNNTTKVVVNSPKELKWLIKKL